MKSYKIDENVYLNESIIELPKEEIKVAKPTSHQYIIIDRSGSMWNDLDLVVDTVIKYVDTLSEGSSVSLGYFSGYSEYSLSVPYVLTKEKDGVVKTANTYRDSMGMTNFIEILDKVKSDCVNRPSSLFFFTDGCHNCGPFTKVIDILHEMKQFIEVSVFVGCGRIDRDNMTEMAKTTGGSFIQLTDFSEFETALNNFKASVDESNPGVYVELPKDSYNICSVLGKNIISYEKDSATNTIFYRPNSKVTQLVYFLSSSPHAEVTEISPKNELAARAITHNLIQNNNTPTALKVLNKLGDKYFMRKLNNTFTCEEYADIENELLKSVFDSKKRYKEGKVDNYLPDDNAWCVLDCLDVITNDKQAIVHLNDSEFEYKSTSRKSVQTDGSKLEFPKDIKANTNNLKYHENRLNVNLNVNYNAIVPLNPNEFKQTNALNESLSSYGLFNGYLQQVTCMRNYNIILDGKLQTKKLILSNLTKDSINKLGNNLTLRKDKKYVLDLSTLPIINKSYLHTTSAKQLAEDCWHSFLLNNEISVLKHLKACKSCSVETGDSNLIQFLSENYYIKNGMYQPPKTSVEATDEYMSYEFSVSFKGYSKASASSVIRKINAKESITDRERIVEFFYNKHKNLELKDIDSTLDKVSLEYKQLQSNIQHAKFAIVLINRGCMDEFKSRDNMNLDLDVSKYGMHVAKVTTNFKVVQKPVRI